MKGYHKNKLVKYPSSPNFTQCYPQIHPYNQTQLYPIHQPFNYPHPYLQNQLYYPSSQFVSYQRRPVTIIHHQNSYYPLEMMPNTKDKYSADCQSPTNQKSNYEFSTRYQDNSNKWYDLPTNHKTISKYYKQPSKTTKNKQLLQNQPSLQIRNSKISINNTSFPILNKCSFSDTSQINYQRLNTPSITSNSQIKYYFDGPSLTSKKNQQYYTPPSTKLQCQTSNHQYQSTPIQNNLIQKRIITVNSERRFKKHQKLIQNSKSNRNLLKKQINDKNYGINTFKKVNNYNHQYYPITPNLQSSVSALHNQKLTLKKNNNNHQDFLQPVPKKLSMKDKKQALINLKNKYKQQNKKQIFNFQPTKPKVQITKQQINKIKQTFKYNSYKKLQQNGLNKLPLQVIQQHPFKNKKISLINSKKPHFQPNKLIKQTKILTKTIKPARFSQQLIINPQMTNNVYASKQFIKLDQTMQTQQIKLQSIKISDFSKGRQLGFGKFGIVNLARHRKTGLLYALKTLKKAEIIQQKIVNQVIRQIKIQYFFNHSNLVKLYGFFFDKDYLYLIMQFCPQGQLYQALQKKKKFPQEDTCQIMKQLCQGINQMHKYQVIHRDIKPQNVVVSFGVYKICDFGWSIYNKNKFRNTICGTPLYFSPQLLLKKSYNEKVDIWALGIMAFQMITGSIPFTITKKDQLIKIVNQQIHYPISMSCLARDFIGMFLQKNPQFRFPLSAIINHNFLLYSKDLNFKSIQFNRITSFQ